MTNSSISIGITNRFFYKAIDKQKKIYLIINTSPQSELSKKNGISPTSDLYVAGYLFCSYF